MLNIAAKVGMMGHGGTRWSDTGRGASSASPMNGYGYDPDNRRVLKVVWTWNGSSWNAPAEEISYFAGQKLSSYTLTATGGANPSMTLTAVSHNVYFGSRLIRKVNADGTVTAMQADRLGSFGKYAPYGEQRDSYGSGDNTDKFATYYRDAGTGLDYAVNRYYNSASGRFTTADPYRASAGAEDPGSWNRYGYVGGDPLNRLDPQGLEWIEVDTYWLPDCAVNTDCRIHVYSWRDETGGEKQDLAQGVRSKNAEERLTPKNVSANAAVTAVIASIAAAFSSGKDDACSKWFDAAFASSPNRAVFSSLASYLNDGVAALSGAGDVAQAGINAEASPNIPGWVIVVNRGGSFFKDGIVGNGDRFSSQIAGINGGSSRAQVFIMLHEIAHLLGMIRSGDTPLDPSGDINQRFNNDSIWNNCSSFLSDFSNRSR